MTAHRMLHDSLIAESELIDPGAGETVAPDRDQGVLSVETSAAESRTLAAPHRLGQEVTVVLETDGGDLTLTQEDTEAIDQAGNTTVTFANAGDWANFVAIRQSDSLVWRLKNSDGVALS